MLNPLQGGLGGMLTSQDLYAAARGEEARAIEEKDKAETASYEEMKRTHRTEADYHYRIASYLRQMGDMLLLRERKNAKA